MIFGRKMAKRLKLWEVHSFSPHIICVTKLRHVKRKCSKLLHNAVKTPKIADNSAFQLLQSKIIKIGYFLDYSIFRQLLFAEISEIVKNFQ